MANVRLDGRKGILHFIRFPTAEMDKFILLCKMKNLKSVAKTICATGWAIVWQVWYLSRRHLSLKIKRWFRDASRFTLYFLITPPPQSGGGAYKFESDFRDLLEMDLLKFDELNSLIDGIHYIHYINPSKECFYYRDPFNDRGNFSKENYDFSNPYPYLVVNIGSGVSILAGNDLLGNSFVNLLSVDRYLWIINF